MANCTELRACSYEQATSDENLQFTNTILSDGRNVTNIYKLYHQEGNPRAILLVIDSIRDPENIGQLVKCNIKNSLLDAAGITKEPGVAIPSDNSIVVFKLNRDLDIQKVPVEFN